MAHRRHSHSSYTPHMARYTPSVETSPSMYSQASLPRSEDYSSAHYQHAYTDRMASDRYRSSKKPRSSSSHTPSLGSGRASVDSSAAYYAAHASLYRPSSSQPSKTSHGLGRIREDDGRSAQDRGYYRDSPDLRDSSRTQHSSSSSHRHYRQPNPLTRQSNNHYTPSTYSFEALFPSVESPALCYPTSPSPYHSHQPPTEIIIETSRNGYKMATLDQSRSTRGPRDAYSYMVKYVEYDPITNSALNFPSASSMENYPRNEIYRPYEVYPGAYTPPPFPSIHSDTTITAYSAPHTTRTVRYDALDTYIETEVLKQQGFLSRLFKRNKSSSSWVSKANGDTPYPHTHKSPATSVKSLPAKALSVGSRLRKTHKPSSSVSSNIGDTRSFRSSRTSASASSHLRKLIFPFSIFTSRKRSNSVSDADFHSCIKENHPTIGKKGPRFSARKSDMVTGYMTEDFSVEPDQAAMVVRALKFSEGRASMPYPQAYYD